MGILMVMEMRILMVMGMGIKKILMIMGINKTLTP
jgi:hypothetical protein